MPKPRYMPNFYNMPQRVADLAFLHRYQQMYAPGVSGNALTPKTGRGKGGGAMWEKMHGQFVKMRQGNRPRYLGQAASSPVSISSVLGQSPTPAPTQTSTQAPAYTPAQQQMMARQMQRSLAAKMVKPKVPGKKTYRQQRPI